MSQTSLTITGTLVQVSPINEISETFQKRDFVINVNDGKYDQEILFELHGDRTDIIEEYADGESITVTFNLRGRRYVKSGQDDKFFNSLIAWKLERA